MSAYNRASQGCKGGRGGWKPLVDETGTKRYPENITDKKAARQNRRHKLTRQKIDAKKQNPTNDPEKRIKL